MLIDVKDRCIVSGNVHAKYIALSYTWQDDTRKIDDPEQLQLLESNVNSMKRIDELKRRSSELPKVIKDAMEFTTAIEKRYLWVDRLCIIQDDPQKEAEFMRMDQIYSGAYMTIVAAAKHGLYGTPDGTVQNPGLKPQNCSFKFLDDSTRIGMYHSDVSLPKWAKRAWTY